MRHPLLFVSAIALVTVSCRCSDEAEMESTSSPPAEEKAARKPASPEPIEARPQAVPPPRDASVDSSPATLVVPTGLKGLRFGMRLEEVNAALGKSLKRQRARQVSDSRAEAGDLDRFAETMPGFMAWMTTTFGTDKALCGLEFDAAELLGGMSCEVRGGEAVYTGMHESLVRQYGPPTETWPTRRRGVTARWISHEAQLELLRARRATTVKNRSADHYAAMRAAAVRAKEAREAWQADEKRRREEAAKILDRDLGGPAENPQSE